jgi:hypothetical protein
MKDLQGLRTSFWKIYLIHNTEMVTDGIGWNWQDYVEYRQDHAGIHESNHFKMRGCDLLPD